MKERTTEAERLAALLDGRLEGEDRHDVLEQLATSDQSFEAYVEAVAVTRELEMADIVGGVTPLRPQAEPWWQGTGARALAAAAGLAVILALPFALDERGEPEAEPATFVALLEQGGRLTPNARPASPWPVRRSSGIVATDSGIALRLGAELAWLDVAVRAGDPEAIRRSATEIEALLDGVPAGAPLAAVYRSVAANPGRPRSELGPLLDQAASSASRMAGDETVALGAWLELARVAADRQDTEFFQDPAGRRLLERTGQAAWVQQDGRAALARTVDLLDPTDEAGWEALQRELQNLPITLSRSQ